jgi:5'-3' exoribonuclease 2
MVAEDADGLWGGLAVVVSDGTVPGEGEHKALRFIRSQRTTPSYDPNTRHCIEGLDADMMLLALATHELHVAVSFSFFSIFFF